MALVLDLRTDFAGGVGGVAIQVGGVVGKWTRRDDAESGDAKQAK